MPNILWRDFSANTIIHENNSMRHLILGCNTFATLNYSHKNIFSARQLAHRTDFFVLYSRLPYFIWGDKDSGYGGTVAHKGLYKCGRSICHGSEEEFLHHH